MLLKLRSLGLKNFINFLIFSPRIFGLYLVFFIPFHLAGKSLFPVQTEQPAFVIGNVLPELFAICRIVRTKFPVVRHILSDHRCAAVPAFSPDLFADHRRIVFPFLFVPIL